jgi:hypothetical protein
MTRFANDWKSHCRAKHAVISEAGHARAARSHSVDLNSAATLRFVLMLAETRVLAGLALASQDGASSRSGGWYGC